MLVERQIPLELSALKGSHCRVLLGLLRYADKEGLCWPSLRTLAAAVPMAIRGVRRALEEMEGLGYLVVERGCGQAVSRYRVAAHLLRATGRPVKPPTEVAISGAPENEETEVDVRQLAFDFASPRSVRILAGSVRTMRTEGLAKKDSSQNQKERALAENEGRVHDEKGSPPERKAPPEVRRIPTADKSPALKADIRSQQITKLIRFVSLRTHPAVADWCCRGLMGEDPEHDEQWWRDLVDWRAWDEGWDHMRPWKDKNAAPVRDPKWSRKKIFQWSAAWPVEVAKAMARGAPEALPAMPLDTGRLAAA